jgi:hypothetical protein
MAMPTNLFKLPLSPKIRFLAEPDLRIGQGGILRTLTICGECMGDKHYILYGMAFSARAQCA